MWRSGADNPRIAELIHEYRENHKTNYDRLRAKSVEEMAEFMSGVEAEAIRRAGLFLTVGDIQRGKEGWLDWLKKEEGE